MKRASSDRKTGILSWLTALAVAGMAIFGVNGAVQAQPNRKMHTGSVMAAPIAPIDLASVSDAQAFSQTITIDSTFENRFGVAVPQPFRLALPETGNDQLVVSYPDAVDNAYLRLSRSTFAGGLVETLDVVPLRIEPGTPASQRQIMTQLLITRVFASLTARYINKSLDGVNIYGLSGTVSVVLNGTYWDPRAGNVAVRIYGVMPGAGGSADGLLFFSQAYLARSGDETGFGEHVVRSVMFE